MADFLARQEVHPNTDLLVVRADLQGTGANQIFVSWADSVDGQQGNIWDVYIPANGYYGLLDDPAIFRSDAFFIERGGGHPGLVTYFPDGANDGALVKYVFDGSRLSESVLERIDPQGQGGAQLTSMFSNSSRNLEVIPAAKVASLLAEITAASSGSPAPSTASSPSAEAGLGNASPASGHADGGSVGGFSHGLYWLGAFLVGIAVPAILFGIRRR